MGPTTGILERLQEGAFSAGVGGVILGTTATLMLATTGWRSGDFAPPQGLNPFYPRGFDCTHDSRSLARKGWKRVFLSGFTVGGVVGGILYPAGLDQMGSPAISRAGLVISGLLVGLGTRLGNGCTSGHGLCGLPRLSRRSIVATLTFLTSGVATASVMATWNAHGGDGRSAEIAAPEAPSIAIRSFALATAAACAVSTLVRKAERANVMAHLGTFICGASFAGGLVLSGMAQRSKVAGFLALRPDSWDPALLLVLGFGVMTTLVGFPLVMGTLAAPVCHREVTVKASSDGDAPQTLKFEIPTSTELDLPLILGSWTFGVGWGAGGLCPGPAIVASVHGLPGPALFFIPSMLVGMKLAAPLKRLDALPDPNWLAARAWKADPVEAGSRGAGSKKSE